MGFGDDPTPPETLAHRYRMEEEIGRGGMRVLPRDHELAQAGDWNNAK